MEVEHSPKDVNVLHLRFRDFGKLSTPMERACTKWKPFIYFPVVAIPPCPASLLAAVELFRDQVPAPNQDGLASHQRCAAEQERCHPYRRNRRR